MTIKKKTVMALIKQILILLTASLPFFAVAEFIPETASVATLPDHSGKNWFWVAGARIPNNTDGRVFLFDDQGKTLGQLSTGHWFNSIVAAKKRNELITVETYFSRGTRGERTDVVVVYDPRTLSPIREISIPSKRMNAVKSSGLVALTEDEKFLLVVNYTPAQSVSVVNLDTSEFVAEIDTPGCSVIYPGGNRDFYSICGNGGFLHIRLDEHGQASLLERTASLFDPVHDFLTISASQVGDIWYFVSRKNNVYAIKMQTDNIELLSKWPLASKTELDDNWTISGFQHTAAHRASGRLYVLMHQGDEHTFEEPGTHVWVYDVNTRKKIDEITLKDLALSINVSQTEKPRLYSLAIHIPLPSWMTFLLFIFEGQTAITPLVEQVANTYDADNGEHLNMTAFLPAGFVLDIAPW